METQTLSALRYHTTYFGEFVQLLAHKFRPLQIFCFAKNIEISLEDGCFTGQKTAYHCNYCLLLATESATRIDYEVQDFANVNYAHGTVTIIGHSIKSIADAVAENSRFFIAACGTGNLLYSCNGIMMGHTGSPFIPTGAGARAQKHLGHRISLANGFLTSARACLDTEQCGIATFMLHQAVEQACIALVRIHVGYRSEFHNLHRLLRLCGCFSNRPYSLLLSTADDKRRFCILVRSYSGARYKSSFSVPREDAEQLYGRVSALVALALTMCTERIAQLDMDEVRYGQPEPTYVTCPT